MARRDRSEYLQAYRAANREKAAACTREWRRADPERARQSQRASYLRNRDKCREAMREYQRSRPVETQARIERWRAANPERALLIDAKVLLSAATGIRIAEVPLALAEAKAAQLAVVRALRAARDTDGSPKGPDRNGLDGEAATAGAEGIAR